MKKASILLLLTILIGCTTDEEPVIDMGRPVLPDAPHDYLSRTLPGHFSFLNFNEPIDNPSTNEGITLGRVLFYDRKLSVSNTISCGSCHQQSKGFADGRQFSKGVRGKETSRNSPTTAYTGIGTGFFWDQRANTLEELALMPIANHIEMGIENLEDLPAKLEQVDYYPQLFQDAFGSGNITTDRIAKSIAQFLRATMNPSSKYDRGAEVNFSNFSALERRGKDLFFDELHCKSCHAPPTFGSNWKHAANIGLDLEYSDKGLGGSEGAVELNGLFKVPVLRNVAETGPYMHDGRYETLMQVVEHYDNGVQNHPNLAWELIDEPSFWETGELNPLRLNLTQYEKEALVAFMETLSDEKLQTDPYLSDPF